MAKNRKIPRTLLIGIAALAVILAVGWAFMPKPVEVDMGEVMRSDLTIMIEEEGRTKVRETYVVSTPVAGRLLRVDVNPGDAVEQSKTVVARMRPTEPVVLDSRTREQASALVDAATAALRLAEANLAATLVSSQQAKSEYDRTQALFDSDIVSQAALERALSAFRAERAKVETAEAAIAMRKAELANARANLVGREDLALANALEGRRDDDIPLLSPTDGRILRVIQESETTLPAGAPVVEIGNIADDLEVEVSLISSDAVRVSLGDPVILSEWGGENDLRGTVSRIDPLGVTKFSALGVEEQRVQVEIDLLSPTAERPGLGHGYRLKVGIIIWQRDDVLTVPASALFRQGDMWAVFAVDDNVDKLTPVSIGRSNGISTEVTEGLSQGQKVIIYPSAALQDGLSVVPRGLN